MSQSVLVVNSGSSSLKYQVVDGDGQALAVGLIERIGHGGGHLTHTAAGTQFSTDIKVPDHHEAMAAMMAAFTEYGPTLTDLNIVAVGHRVVQGGDLFTGAVLIDDAVLAAIDELATLAPLHNPGNAAGIAVARAQFPDLPHVAVFDTAFHSTIPPVAHTYALDRDIARTHRIRRYGFHGTSHSYVSREAARFLGREVEDVNLIVLHLGNGASACAVRGGQSVDTSMGLTPLEGLVMGTRTGDIDPAIAFHLSRSAGMDIDALDSLFNKRSGMLGLTGRTDMRDIESAAQAGDADARLALDIYYYRLRHYLGAYTAVLGRVDAIVFTAGIGENSATVRAGAVAGLEGLGIVLDPAANLAGHRPRDISRADSRVRLLVIGTNEEAEIARQAAQVAATGLDEISDVSST
ncbi:MAG: acetate/propionate family kinase [Beutenbergiaceae bacterium]